MSKKTIEELEIEKGYVILGDVDLKEKLTDEEFISLAETNGFHGVNFEDRIKFLKDNGYEVTRENLIDSSLSCRS